MEHTVISPGNKTRLLYQCHICQITCAISAISAINNCSDEAYMDASLINDSNATMFLNFHFA